MKTVYVAFDFNDEEAKNEFLRQSGLPDCPFQLKNCSIEKPIDKGWPAEAEKRIRGCDCVLVLCGAQTHQSGGAGTEVQIAQRLDKRFVLVAATRQATPTPPPHVPAGTPIYTWRWPTVGALIDGRAVPENSVVRYT